MNLVNTKLCLQYLINTNENENFSRSNYRSKSIRVYNKKYKRSNELTEEIAVEAPDKINDLIFIKKDIKTGVKPYRLDLFYRYFKKITNELELENGPYTIYDFRHTYMTTLFEEAVKDGRLDIALMASGHRDIATTIKHYIRPDIRNYLEAFYRVKIGNVNILGQIAEKIEDANIQIPSDLREIKVNDCTGYCTGECTEKNIDCLLCRKFLVTLEEISKFNNKIREIDEKIKNEALEHQKEHLVSIKKLYVAYLAALYSFKEK